jgi:hypothetical protein
MELYPRDYEVFKSSYSAYWLNELTDFFVVVEATFIMAQYNLAHPDAPLKFLLVSNDNGLIQRYSNSDSLLQVLDFLNIKESIQIISFYDFQQQ